jgi:hypothetical protein
MTTEDSDARFAEEQFLAWRFDRRSPLRAYDLAEDQIAHVTWVPEPLRCAPKARLTSGGRFHPGNCRLTW